MISLLSLLESEIPHLKRHHTINKKLKNLLFNVTELKIKYIFTAHSHIVLIVLNRRRVTHIKNNCESATAKTKTALWQIQTSFARWVSVKSTRGWFIYTIFREKSGIFTARLHLFLCLFIYSHHHWRFFILRLRFTRAYIVKFVLVTEGDVCVF